MMILLPIAPLSPTRDYTITFLRPARDDLSSLLDTTTDFPARLNVFFSSSSRKTGIFIIKDCWVWWSGAKRHYSCPVWELLLNSNSTFFLNELSRVVHRLGQTDTVANVTVCRSKRILKRSTPSFFPAFADRDEILKIVHILNLFNKTHFPWYFHNRWVVFPADDWYKVTSMQLLC